MNFRFLCLLLIPVATCFADEKVSMIRLISTPEQFVGRDIILSGYLKIEHENQAIYFDKSQADWGATENAIWLELTEEQKAKWKAISGNVVFIGGRYEKRISDDSLTFSGRLTNIFRIDKKIRYEDIIKTEATSVEDAMRDSK